jgi:DNA-binding MarR family transcriptional regulator
MVIIRHKRNHMSQELTYDLRMSPEIGFVGLGRAAIVIVMLFDCTAIEDVLRRAIPDFRKMVSGRTVVNMSYQAQDMVAVIHAIEARSNALIDLGLTSARWQILGAIIAADRPQPVAWLARDLGTNRQNVQRIINDLQREGFVAFEANPHHRRAQLVVLTDKGRQTFDAAMRLQGPWINRISAGLSVRDIETVHRVMTALRKNLEDQDEARERA